MNVGIAGTSANIPSLTTMLVSAGATVTVHEPSRLETIETMMRSPSTSMRLKLGGVKPRVRRVEAVPEVTR